MSLRWRLTGELLCAAKCDAKEGDTYFDDGHHYFLAVIVKVIYPDINEQTNGLWHWEKIDGWREKMPLEFFDYHNSFYDSYKIKRKVYGL